MRNDPARHADPARERDLHLDQRICGANHQRIDRFYRAWRDRGTGRHHVLSSGAGRAAALTVMRRSPAPPPAGGGISCAHAQADSACEAAGSAA